MCCLALECCTALKPWTQVTHMQASYTRFVLQILFKMSDCCLATAVKQDSIWRAESGCQKWLFYICHLHSQNFHPIALYVTHYLYYHWLWAQEPLMTNMVAKSDCNRMDINWVQVKHANLESAYRQLWHSGDFSDTSAWFLSGWLNHPKSQFWQFYFQWIQSLSVSSKFPICLLSISNRCH